MAEKVLHDDDTQTVIEVTSDGWPEKAGSVRTVRIEWKPGHEPEPTIEDRLAAVEAALDLDPADAKRATS